MSPLLFVRRSSDYSRSFNAAFSLAPGENSWLRRIIRCLDKRGQKVVLWTDDANGVQNETMYKPIPFFKSSRGLWDLHAYIHPITCDFGSTTTR
ncbi:MAG: hypothetical protein U0T82_04230 [Bacteroidales bacterium]